MAVCPLQWLLAPAVPDQDTSWLVTGVLRTEPTLPLVLVLPVRDLRVMYGLKTRHYQGMVHSQIPHAHEFFVPMETLTAEDGDQDPALQSLVARASAASNFLPGG